MANAIYTKGKEKILQGQIDFATDAITVALVKNTYSPNLANDEFFTAISAHVVSTPQALATKTVTNGVFDAADPAFLAVAAGSTLKGAVIYKDTGVAGTSALLHYIDDITGFPFTTNGSDVTVRWSDGAYKIFAL